MKIGLNPYGAAKWLEGSLDNHLERLKDIGFTSFEVDMVFTSAVPQIVNNIDAIKAGMGVIGNSVWLDSTAEENMALLKKHGLQAISAHVMLESHFGVSLVDLVPAMKEFAGKYGIKYYVKSSMKSTIEEIDKEISEFNKVASELKKEGITLVYHNHEVELQPTNGTTILDYIMKQCPDVMLQLDVGWVQYAGISPVEIMKKYRDRIVMLHLKDIRSDASPETRDNCYTAIGEGSIPLKEIMAEAKNCRIVENGIIIDQDNSQINIFEDYSVGIKNLKEIW